jgi:hypothetical protein
MLLRMCRICCGWARLLSTPFHKFGNVLDTLLGMSPPRTPPWQGGGFLKVLEFPLLTKEGARGRLTAPARPRHSWSTLRNGVLSVIVLLALGGCHAGRHAGESSTGAQTTDLSFDCQTLTGMGATPYAVAAGDWNGDGKLDIAVSSASWGAVSVFFNRGRRKYELGTDVLVGHVSRSLVTGDINGDGVLDLAVANAETDDVAIVLADGKGGLKKVARYRTGVAPFDVVLADVDGDGLLDAVVANESNALVSGTRGTVSVLYGQPGATFSQPLNLEVGDHPAAVQVIDLDGQHGPDIAVANWKSDSVSILLNRGDRTFEPSATIAYGGGLPYSLYAHDLDGDGAADLAVTDITNQAVRVLYGDGTGKFPRSAAFGVGKGTRWVTGADVNGDGIVDLLTADTASNTVSILIGKPHGDFAPAVAVAVGQQPRALIARDLDGDGRVDIAVANMSTNDVSLLFQTSGKGRPCPPPATPAPPS